MGACPLVVNGVELVLSPLFLMAYGKNGATCWLAGAVRTLRKRVEWLEAKDSFKNVRDWGGEIDKNVADDVIKLHTEYHVPAPAASYAASASVVEYIVPAVFYVTPAPVVEFTIPAAAYFTPPVPMVENIAPATSYVTPASVVDHIAPTLAVIDVLAPVVVLFACTRCVRCTSTSV